MWWVIWGRHLPAGDRNVKTESGDLSRMREPKGQQAGAEGEARGVLGDKKRKAERWWPGEGPPWSPRVSSVSWEGLGDF